VYWQQPVANGTYIVTTLLMRYKTPVIYAKIGEEIRSNLIKFENYIFSTRNFMDQLS